MDWRKGVDDPSQLGCIFDNPVAYEDSSYSRKKIDCGNNFGTTGAQAQLECQIKGLSSGRSVGKMKAHSHQRDGKGVKGGGKGSGYDPTISGVVQPSRRKLCFGDDPCTKTPTGVFPGAASESSSSGGAGTSLTSSSSSGTPLLEDCEIFSDIGDDDFPELRLESARSPASPTPVCSPVSTRSLDHHLELVNIPESRCLSRAESFSSLKAVKDGQFSVYPGWSLWSRDHSHSYRSLTPESPHSAEGSTKAFPGVKSLKTSLYQHLVSAAGQRYTFPGMVNRSASLRSILSSGSSRSWIDTNNMRTPSSKCTCGNAISEESKVPLLMSQSVSRQRGKWEPIAYLRKGLRSLTFSSGSQDLRVPSVFPCLDIPSLFLRHRKVLPEKRRKCIVSQQKLDLESSRMMITGYLQSMSRQGSVSYSFWMDEVDEVLVAKLEQREGSRCISFYTCRGGNNSSSRTYKTGWRRLSRARTVNLVATMSVSFHVFTGVDSRGQSTHFMDSEFSLLDHARRPLPGLSSSGGNIKRKFVSTSTLRSLWRKSSLNSRFDVSSPAAATGLSKSRKELAAVVIRMPLEVKRESFGSRVAAKSSGNEIEVSESVHVVLPRGEHGGVDGPRPLAERWRSGGVCDCGSWDLGCGIITLSQGKNNDNVKVNKSTAEEPELLNLKVEGWKGEVVGMSVGVCGGEEGLFRLRYQRPMVALQAFATAVAVLEEKRGEFRRCLWKVEENETKLPVNVIAPTINPPLSPIHRL